MIKLNKSNIGIFLDFLDESFYNAKCELNYSKDYELVIAVMLSAQTTDAKVNKTTAILFSKYESLLALSKADFNDVELIIRPLGLSKSKAKNVIGIARMLLNKFDGKVPSEKKILQELPGIGNKSAGVIRAEIFKIPDLPVDTHISRICKRLGIASNNDDPLKIENKLKKLTPEKMWIKLHHQIIFFGRYMCTAKKPACNNCKMCEFCRVFEKQTKN